jgi:flagellar basal body rod protein FlgG
MNVSLTQAAAAMNASARWQEVIAENLATSSIPGARKRQLSFSSVEAGLAPAGIAQPTGGFVIPRAQTSINFEQGMSRPTGIATDLAIEGPGFFEVQLPNGSRAFTRDGEFHINAQGQLTTKQGYLVLGNNLVLGDNAPLQFDSNNANPIAIAPGGEVSQGGEDKGRILMFEFKDPRQLTLIGDGYFIADNPRIRPLPSSPATQIRQGFLETSNTSPTAEMANLITSMRMFEANQKVMQTQDDRMGKIISDLGGQ